MAFWEFEGGFDSFTPQIPTFYDNGEYSHHIRDTDCDEDSGGPPLSPIEVSFIEDGSSFIFVLWDATLTRVD